MAPQEEQLAHASEQSRLKDQQLQLAQEQLRAAQARIEELEKQRTPPPPPLVKANEAKPKAEDEKTVAKKGWRYHCQSRFWS